VRGDDLFGASIALDPEGRLLVGAPSMSGPGAVYYFRKEGDNWTFKQKIVEKDPLPSDRGFGTSVSLTAGGYGVVGAPFARPNPDYGTSGVAFPLTLGFVDGLWHVGKGIQPPAASGWAEFGHKVLVDSTFGRLIISAPGAFSREFQNPGHVYIYHLSSFMPGPEYDLVGDTSAARFGEDFSMSAYWIAMGEPNYRTRPDSADGAVIVTWNNPR
jgi:hypothetical protein